MKKSPKLLESATTGTVFTSGANIFDPLEVLVPEEILNTCRNIQDKFKGLEWSILVKGSITERGYEIVEDFVIPKQTVSGGEVNFTDTSELEAYRTMGFNSIIHSHPFKSESFSNSDRTTLSVNYECSILFSMGDFTTSTVSFKIGADNESLLLINAKVGLLTTYIELPPNIESLITRVVHTRPVSTIYGDGWYNQGNHQKVDVVKEVELPVKRLTYLDDLAKSYGDPNEFRC